MAICFYCKKEIGENEDFCSLVSYSGGEIMNSDSWHRDCWLKWLEEKMDLKVKNYAKDIMDKAMPLLENSSELGKLKGLLGKELL